MIKLNRRHALKGLVGGTLLSPAVYGQLPDESKNSSPASIETLDTDVVVVGAGASGVPAAIAAARHNANVVLLEEDNVVGGAPVDMYVALLCGWPRVGIFRQMVDLLQNHHHLLLRPVETHEEKFDTWFTPTSYQLVLQKMLSAEKNITVLCGAKAIGVLTDDHGQRQRVKGVYVRLSPHRRLLVRTKFVIDASGNGEICESAGCTIMYGREAKSAFNEPLGRDKPDDATMPCTWMYISQKFGPLQEPTAYERLASKGCIDSGLGWFMTNKEEFYRRDIGCYLHWGGTALCKDTRNPVEVAKTQQAILEKIRPDIETLFKAGYTVHLAPKVGIREARRIMGEFVITENDMKSGKFQDDNIATGEYYLDLWGRKLTEEEKRLPPFGIPYRSLIPKGFEGLYAVGKILSGTHIAMSAYRVQPIVAQTGQAAGTAAALAVQNRCESRDVDIKQLRELLRQDNLPV